MSPFAACAQATTANRVATLTRTPTQSETRFNALPFGFRYKFNIQVEYTKKARLGLILKLNVNGTSQTKRKKMIGAALCRNNLSYDV